MLALLSAIAALAPAATVAREGDELVYRGAPGQQDRVGLVEVDGTAQLLGLGAQITAGAGCERVRRRVECPIEGITAIRVLAGDGDDDVHAELELPLIVDLGPGNDQFGGDSPSLVLTGGDGSDEAWFGTRTGTIDMGPGNDIADVVTFDLTGPLVIAGGDGDDRLFIFGETHSGTALAGGPGNDWFTVQSGAGPGVDIDCGPGADRIIAGLEDRPGEGCGPHLAGITPRTVSRAFREGSLTAPAAGSVTFRRDRGDGDAAETVARGRFDAPAGPLRVRLKMTKAGRRAIRGDRRLGVIVTVRARGGGEHHEVTFASKLKPAD